MYYFNQLKPTSYTLDIWAQHLSSTSDSLTDVMWRSGHSVSLVCVFFMWTCKYGNFILHTISIGNSTLYSSTERCDGYNHLPLTSRPYHSVVVTICLHLLHLLAQVCLEDSSVQCVHLFESLLIVLWDDMISNISWACLFVFVFSGRQARKPKYKWSEPLPFKVSVILTRHSLHCCKHRM